MASRKTTGLFYNLILTLALFLLLMTSLLGLEIPTSMALEQSPRCGQAEHHHTQDCYLGEVLLCSRKAHTHSQSCYLVNLRDNDINSLLQSLSEGSEGSLEELIRFVMSRALDSSPEYSVDSMLMRLSQADITALNDAILGDDSIPDLLLNQNLGTGITLQYTPMEPGIALLAFPEKPATGTLAINFYVRLDGTIKLVGTGNQTEVNGYGTNYRCSAEVMLSAYNTDYLISNVSTNTLSTYALKYTTSSNITSDTSFTTGIRVTSNSYYSFGRTSGTKYVLLTTPSSNGWNTTYTPVDFYTVTLDYATYAGGENQVQYVQSGQASTLTLSTQYEWYDAPTGGNKVTTTTPGTIRDTTTLYARPKGYTVTYLHNNAQYGQRYEYQPSDGVQPMHTVVAPPADHVWVLQGGDINTAYKEGVQLAVSGNMTFESKELFDITLNGKKQTMWDGQTLILPAPPADTLWQDENGNLLAAGTAVPVSGDLTFTSVRAYTVTLVDKAGNVTSRTVREGGTINLPEASDGYNWYDADGNTYTGTLSSIRANITLTEGRVLTLNYNVNFSAPDDITAVLPTTPTLAGMPGTTTSVTTNPSAETVLLGVVPRDTSLSTGNDAHGFKRIGHFLGWKVGNTNTILLPNASYSNQELEAYANSFGIVTLTGQWSTDWSHSANFVIKFDSVATGATDRGKYTDSIYTTYVGNVAGTYSEIVYGSENSAQTVQNDATIRALEGEKSADVLGNDIWFYDIPSDDYVFEQLKNIQAGGDERLNKLEIDGVVIPIEDLNSDTFTIRWYVVKYYNNDGWHVDGALVRKVGNIVVTKTFDGKSNYVEKAQDGFYISASAGYYNDDGKFVDNTNLANYTLTVDRKAQTTDTTTIGYQTKETIENPTSGTTQVNYTWVIPNVGAGEIWQIQEHLVPVDSAAGYGEWIIVDSSNTQSKEGQGTVTTVEGVTFPEDISSTEWLRADFTNVYHTENSLLIRKVDAMTGDKLSGAAFQFFEGAGMRPMRFIYNSDTNTYEYRQGATEATEGTTDIVLCDGSEIFIGDFSFEYANITIKEVTAPAGYILEEHPVIIGYNGDTNENGSPVVSICNPDEAGSYASFSNGLLTISNRAKEYRVTARKQWLNCSTEEWTDSVRVQLLANGSASLAADLLPNGVNSIQTLTKVDNGDGTFSYSTYTWENVPSLAGGNPITWSLKEIRVGDEEINNNGVFPNWNSYVGLPEYSADRTEQIITVTNMPKASTMLRILKTDIGMTQPLAGATFTISDTRGNVLATATTDSFGTLNFYRLKYETTYVIQETIAPAGCLPMTDPIYVKIYEDGRVEVEDHDYALPGNSNFTLRVKNVVPVSLPETGGTGTQRYAQSGLLLILLAAVLWIYNRLPGIPAAAAPRGQRRKFRQISTFRMLPPGPGPAPAEPVPRESPKPHRKEALDSS